MNFTEFLKEGRLDEQDEIKIEDIVDLLGDLTADELAEVMDFIADYFEDKDEDLEYVDADDSDMTELDGDGEVSEKIIKRKNKRTKKIVLTTDKPGYKVVDGKEVKMSPAEVKNRAKSAKKAAKKRKGQAAAIAKKAAKTRAMGA